jgi:hypothetical protein
MLIDNRTSIDLWRVLIYSLLGFVILLFVMNYFKSRTISPAKTVKTMCVDHDGAYFVNKDTLDMMFDKRLVPRICFDIITENE